MAAPFFDRKSRRLYLNQQGQKFLCHVRQALAELEAGKEELRTVSKLLPLLRLGASSSRLFPKIVTDYLLGHRGEKFQLQQLFSLTEMQQKLLMQELEFCLSFEPLTSPSIISQHLTTEEIMLAVSPSHPLAQKSTASLQELKEETFISLTSECGLWETTTHYCRQYDFTPLIGFEINSLEVIANLVQANLGVAFVPTFWQSYEKRSITCLPLTPRCQRHIWLSYAAARKEAIEQQPFYSFLRNYFQSHDKPLSRHFWSPLR
ncbi:MAG: LysR family transcriptional regulator substrate-binding protein, partial [Anaerotignum sp.]